MGRQARRLFPLYVCHFLCVPVDALGLAGEYSSHSQRGGQTRLFDMLVAVGYTTHSRREPARRAWQPRLLLENVTLCVCVCSGSGTHLPGVAAAHPAQQQPVWRGKVPQRLNSVRLTRLFRLSLLGCCVCLS